MPSSLRVPWRVLINPPWEKASMAKKSFYIIRRKDRLTNKKPTFYVRFRDTDGILLAWRSNGETSKTRAELWAQAQLGKSLHRKENITLEAFAKGFWNSDGPFVQKRCDRGFTLSAGYLEISDGYTRNHIIPKWGSSRLRDLTPGQIDRWIIHLRKDSPLAPSTINKILQALRTILEHAVSEKYLQENPAALVKPVKVEQGKRWILTPEEVMKLLGTPEVWPDFRHYIINLIALTTGARLGEIRGLLIENVKHDHIPAQLGREARAKGAEIQQHSRRSYLRASIQGSCRCNPRYGAEINHLLWQCG
jgi:integrase